LVISRQTFYDSVNSYSLAGIKVPTFLAVAHTLDVQPAVQLDSVNKMYYLTITISHTNNPVTGEVLQANTLTSPASRLLHFNGNLQFGNIGTTMTGLGVPPPINNPATTLDLVDGYVTANAAYTYAGAGVFNVNLNAAGDALVTGGSVILNPPSASGSI